MALMPKRHIIAVKSRNGEDIHCHDSVTAITMVPEIIVDAGIDPDKSETYRGITANREKQTLFVDASKRGEPYQYIWVVNPKLAGEVLGRFIITHLINQSSGTRVWINSHEVWIGQSWGAVNIDITYALKDGLNTVRFRDMGNLTISGPFIKQKR